MDLSNKIIRLKIDRKQSKLIQKVQYCIINVP